MPSIPIPEESLSPEAGAMLAEWAHRHAISERGD